MLQLLRQNIEDGFADFHWIKNGIQLFENPLSLDVSTAPDGLQLELNYNAKHHYWIFFR